MEDVPGQVAAGREIDEQVVDGVGLSGGTGGQEVPCEHGGASFVIDVCDDVCRSGEADSVSAQLKLNIS
ncbi:hypothetical protein GCM10025780_20450 [Frondihabitans cladoniiphilus]|uniref:Uncharacterized protein n=1 Tax=Frondihabitans cladoniiphilus TaxID=715785 RepID=A0ABP8VXX9_9MICO